MGGAKGIFARYTRRRMIEFKIISTPDRSQQSTYRHQGTEITFGSSDASMIIDDPQLSPLQIRISFQGSQAILENLNPDVEVRLNGKAVDGSVPIKARDNLSMARTTINFIQLDLSPTPLPPSYVHPQAELRFVADSSEKAVLDVLEFLEREASGASGARPRPSTAPLARPTAAPPLPPGSKIPLPPKPPIPKR